MSWWSGPGCNFSTQTRSADISSKINYCGMTCWKWNQNASRRLAACQSYYCWKFSVYCGGWGFTRIKLSNADCYLWNITLEIYCWMSLVWIWLLSKVCSSKHNVLTVNKGIFIQSRRIDHKHGKMLSAHRNAGLEQKWPRMADENLPTSLLIFCYLVKKTPWIDFLMCYQLIRNKGFII